MYRSSFLREAFSYFVTYMRNTSGRFNIWLVTHGRCHLRYVRFMSRLHRRRFCCTACTPFLNHVHFLTGELNAFEQVQAPGTTLPSTPQSAARQPWSFPGWTPHGMLSTFPSTPSTLPGIPSSFPGTPQFLHRMPQAFPGTALRLPDGQLPNYGGPSLSLPPVIYAYPPAVPPQQHAYAAPTSLTPFVTQPSNLPIPIPMTLPMPMATSYPSSQPIFVPTFSPAPPQLPQQTTPTASTSPMMEMASTLMMMNALRAMLANLQEPVVERAPIPTTRVVEIRSRRRRSLGGHEDRKGRKFRKTNKYAKQASSGSDEKYPPPKETRYDPNFDPRFDPKFAPGLHPHFEATADPQFDFRYPTYDPRLNPQFHEAHNGNIGLQFGPGSQDKLHAQGEGKPPSRPEEVHGNGAAPRGAPKPEILPIGDADSKTQQREISENASHVEETPALSLNFPR